jgi:methylaspartate mutase sigma subunit
MTNDEKIQLTAGHEGMFGTEAFRIVSGVIGDDVHVVGLRILEHAMIHAGFSVQSLGVMVTQNEFIDAALETDAEAIVVSSMNGHGHVACIGFRDKCIERGLENIKLYVGGQLSIADEPWAAVKERYTSLGFDRVYPTRARIRGFIDDVRSDLSSARGSES